jgi:hypothetical protein
MPSSQEIKKQVRERLSRKSGDSQLDLFIALPSDLPARDQQDLMERPFFSLSKNKRTTPIEYRVGENYISVTAPEKYGMATIWDADVLIWAASQITEARERGLTLQRHLIALLKFAPVESRFCSCKQRGKATFDTPINPCARSVCSRSVAVGLKDIPLFPPLSL